MSAYGFVYFVQQGADGPIKIGFAQNPEKRLSDLQGGNPDQLYLRAFIRTAQPLIDEAELHSRFAPHRLRGEWFLPVAPILDLIEQESRPLSVMLERDRRAQDKREQEATRVEVLRAMAAFISDGRSLTAQMAARGLA